MLATTTGACQLVPAKTFSFPHLVVGLDEQACLSWPHLALSILAVDYRYWMLQLLYSQVLKCLTSEQHMTLALVTSYFVNKNKMTDGRKSCHLCLQLYYRTIFSEFFENSNGQKYIAWKKISMKSNSKWTLIHSKIIFNFCLCVHCQIVYGQNGTKVWTVNFFFRSARACYRAFDFHLFTCPVRSNVPFFLCLLNVSLSSPPSLFFSFFFLFFPSAYQIYPSSKYFPSSLILGPRGPFVLPLIGVPVPVHPSVCKNFSFSFFSSFCPVTPVTLVTPPRHPGCCCCRCWS